MVIISDNILTFMINNYATTEIYYLVAVLNHDVESLNNKTLKK